MAIVALLTRAWSLYQLGRSQRLYQRRLAERPVSRVLNLNVADFEAKLRAWREATDTALRESPRTETRHDPR